MHKIITKVKTLNDLKIEATFADGEVVVFDVKTMFSKYPVFQQLESKSLFNSLKIDGIGYGVSWNDDLDLSSDGIYERGEHVAKVEPKISIIVGQAISEVRSKRGISQRELSKKTGIIQSDISRIEQGKGNPTLSTLQKISNSLDYPISKLFS